MKIGRYWILGMVMVVLLLGGCGSKESASVEAPVTTQPPLSEERRVEVVEVVPRSVSYTLTAVGTLKTPENVTISPKKAGIIDEILVKEGDRVKKGQVLVQLNDVDAKLQMERAEAKVQEADASVENNRNTMGRYQKLFETRVISQQTFE